jgi:hypothetical protein
MPAPQRWVYFRLATNGSNPEAMEEQSGLDWCRAFRTGIILATQSVAAMAFKLRFKVHWEAAGMQLT